MPLGADGFRLIRNAMGVHGFHVALNPFSESLHERLFREPAFTRNTQADCVPLDTMINDGCKSVI